MSTGENINANGLPLSAAMIRQGFFKFPQTIVCMVNPAQWPLIPPLQLSADYPFKAFESEKTPVGEIWFIGANGELLGRIVNIASS